MKQVTSMMAACMVGLIFLTSFSRAPNIDNSIPISQWLFDDSGGIIAADAVDSNPAMLLNGAFFSEGLNGNAVQLDGIDDRVEIPNSLNLTITNAVTVETLVNIHSATVGGFPVIVAKWGDGNFGTAGYGLFLGNDGSTPVFVISRDGLEAGPSGLYAPSTLSFNQWHHLVGTYDGTELKLYVDGAQVAQASHPGSIFPTPAPVVIGMYSPDFTNPEAAANFLLAGQIDQTAIYNTALDAVRISQLAQSALHQSMDIVIDVKPDSFPNIINIKSKGLLTVAILSTETFNAGSVDPISIKFAQNNATEAYRHGYIEDVDGDGDLDLVLHFKIQETGLNCGDSAVSLTGSTFDGEKIIGSDSIILLGCNKLP